MSGIKVGGLFFPKAKHERNLLVAVKLLFKFLFLMVYGLYAKLKYFCCAGFFYLFNLSTLGKFYFEVVSAFKQCCQIPGLVQLIKNIVLNLICEKGYATSIIFEKNSTKSESVRTPK